MDALMTIYVPREGTAAARFLKRGSALVGSPVAGEGDLIDCHYEGAVYHQENLEAYFDRLCCAAERRASRYPTAARRGFPADELVAVGEIDGLRGVVISLHDPASVMTWADAEATDVLGERLPAGPTSWEAAAQSIQNGHGRTIGSPRPGHPQGFWYRNRAGQVIRFRDAVRAAEVFEHDDPSLPGMLADLGISRSEISRVTGQAG